MNADVAILLPDLRGGGAEKVCVTLARGFIARGLTVDIVLLQRQGAWLESLPSTAAVVDLGAPRARDAFRPFVRYLRARQPRSLLAAMWPMTTLAVWAVRMGRVRTRVVVSDHNDLVHTPQAASRTGLLRMAGTMRLSYPFADAVVAVSSGVADTIARLSGLRRDSIHVVHNPIEIAPDALAPPPGVAGSWVADSGARRVIAIGSFKAQKDFATLLHALRLVRETRPVKLLLLGEGPLRPDLERLALQLGLRDVVEMPGFVPQPERYLRRADLFVLSSAWEGFGNVIVEALACGVPVVSTDCPSGPREILADGRYGGLVAPRDPAALAAAMIVSLGSTHQREALVARSREFSLDRATERYCDLLLPAHR